MGKVAAMEFGERGIRVNTVGPGLVETNATSAFWMVPGVVDEFARDLADAVTYARHPPTPKPRSGGVYGGDGDLDFGNPAVARLFLTYAMNAFADGPP